MDQVVPITAAVIVTTPQKLAFIDVAKGVQMFSRLKVSLQIEFTYLVDWVSVSAGPVKMTKKFSELNYWSISNVFFFIVWKCSHLKSRKTLLLMVFHWRLQVPSIAVVENMCYFEGDGKRYYPFGQGSGAQVCYITVHWVQKTFQRNDSCFVNRRWLSFMGLEHVRFPWSYLIWWGYWQHISHESRLYNNLESPIYLSFPSDQK